MPYALRGNSVVKKDSGEVVKTHKTREQAVKHLRALKVNVEAQEAVLCECGAPARGPVCQRGHRLQENWETWDRMRPKGDKRPDLRVAARTGLLEAWSPQARAAALAAREEHGYRVEQHPTGARVYHGDNHFGSVVKGADEEGRAQFTPMVLPKAANVVDRGVVRPQEGKMLPARANMGYAVASLISHHQGNSQGFPHAEHVAQAQAAMSAEPGFKARPPQALKQRGT